MLLAWCLHGFGGEDDCYITWGAARILGSTGKLVNYSGVRLEQSSSLTSVVLLAGLWRVLPVEMPWLGYLLSLGSLGATGWLATLVARRLGLAGSGWVGAVCVTLPSLSYWGTGGLEGTFTAALALGLVLLLDRFAADRRLGSWFALAGVLLAFAAVRPECPLVLACLWLAEGVFVLRTALGERAAARAELRRWLALGLLVALSVLPLFYFRHVYFHAWFPHPVMAKDSRFEFGPGLRYVWESLQFNGLHWAVTSLAALLAFLWRFARGTPTSRGLRALVALALAELAFVVGSRGDWMLGGRFLVPMLPLWVLWAATLLPASGLRGLRGAAWGTGLVAVNLLLQVQFLHQGGGSGRSGCIAPRAARAIRAKLTGKGPVPFSNLELGSRLHGRDSFTLQRLLDIVQRARALQPEPLVIWSGQLGMMGYYTTSQFFGQVRFVDLWSLCSNEFLRCIPAAARSNTAWGNFIRLDQAFKAAHQSKPECAIPLPDIVYNECLDPDQSSALSREGYVLVYRQDGRIYDYAKAEFIRPELRACGYVAVRRPLAQKLGLRDTPTWNWDINPR